MENALREAISSGGPHLLWVPFDAGMDPLARLRDAAGEVPLLHLSAPSLPDRHARELWARQAHAVLGRESAAGASWEQLLSALPEDRPLVLSFLGIAALLDAEKRWGREVGRYWSRIRTTSAPIVLVLMERDAQVLAALRDVGGAFRHPSEALRPDLAGPPGRWAPLSIPGFAALARRCAAWSPTDVALGWALLGTSDEVLSAIDPSVRPVTNLRRLVLDPDGPLWDRPLRELRTRFQSPARYAALERALANGGSEWRDFVEELQDEIAANALAPYVTRLRDLGRVQVQRSLDAPVRSRKRRYRLSDPFDSFWWSVVAPLRSDLGTGLLGADDALAALRPALAAHLEGSAPRLAEDAVSNHAEAILGAPVREAGGLWGDGYDLPVAATLLNGAVCYGDVAWGDTDATAALERVSEALRHTRYGYGRQARFRLVLTHNEADRSARTLARRDTLVVLLTLAELVQHARR
ncbi:MAG: hypothetical protein R3E98_12175 [Gemmatimonadota bacterium]